MAIVLGVLAAGLLLVGGLTVSWWSHADEIVESFIGLREMRLCTVEGCIQGSLDRIAASTLWPRAGAASYAAALLAGGLLLVASLALAVRRPSALLVKTSLVATASAAVTGLVFIWLAPFSSEVSAGYSMVSYFVGALLSSIAGMLMLLRSNAAQRA